MRSFRGTRFARAIALTSTLTLVFSAVAFGADQLLADGDGLEPVANNDLDLGSVCPGGSIEAASDNVLLALRAVNRSGGSWFGNSVEVTFTGGTTADLTLTGNLLTTPSNWADLTPQQTPVVGASVGVKVTLDDAGTTEGINSATVTWTASGAGFTRSGGTTSADPAVAIPQGQIVKWTVLPATDASCAPPNTPPELTLPASLTVEGNTLGGANVAYTGISAHDDEDGDLTASVACNPVSDSFFALGGPHTVDCSVTDSGGLSASGSFPVTVVDTTPPTVTPPADITVEGNTTGGASVGAGGATGTALPNFLNAATASDIVWGNVTSSITNNAPALFPLGNTTVTFTATDGSSNQGTGTAVVTVEDTIAPTLHNMPSDITVLHGAEVTWTDPTATDIVDPNPTVACVPASGSAFDLGATTVTCTATDASDNSTSLTFQVHVVYGFSWRSPVVPQPFENVIQAGRTVPLQFYVFDDNGPVDNLTGADVIFLSNTRSCESSGALDSAEIEGENTNQKGLMNLGGGNYKFQWQTPKNGKNCVAAGIGLADGQKHAADFHYRK